MSYGKTNTICDCCGYVGQDYPGVYYMDMFYRNSCGKCGGETWVCSGCAGKKTIKTECKSCIRDKK